MKERRARRTNEGGETPPLVANVSFSPPLTLLLAYKDNVIRDLHVSLEQSKRQRKECETVAMEERGEKDAQIVLVKHAGSERESVNVEQLVRGGRGC